MSPINKCTFLKSVGMSLWVLARFWKWQDPSCLLEATWGYKTKNMIFEPTSSRCLISTRYCNNAVHKVRGTYESFVI